MSVYSTPKRVTNKFKRFLNAKKAISSYPFISGDTYRSLSDLDLTFMSFDNLHLLCGSGEKTVFCPISYKNTLITWLDQNRSFNGERVSLILHNGDNELSNIEASELSSRFKKVLSVNWLGKIDRVISIPIGLENFRLFANGNFNMFPRNQSFSRTEWQNRPIEYFLSLNVLNNINHRSDLPEKIRFSRSVFIPETFLSAIDYRVALSKSKFVISPPGNGPDCHRTWESMYFGAVPVVLKNYWPFTLNLPALSVKSWEDIQMESFSYKLPEINNIVDLLKDSFIDSFVGEESAKN